MITYRYLSYTRTQTFNWYYTSSNNEIFSSNLFESELIPESIFSLYVDMSESHENSQENIHPALRKCRFVFLEVFDPFLTFHTGFQWLKIKFLFFNNTVHLLTSVTVFPFPEFYLLWASIPLISSLVPRVTGTCTFFFVTVNHSFRIKLHQVHLYKTSISLMFNINVYYTPKL